MTYSPPLMQLAWGVGVGGRVYLEERRFTGTVERIIIKKKNDKTKQRNAAALRLAGKCRKTGRKAKPKSGRVVGDCTQTHSSSGSGAWV